MSVSPILDTWSFKDGYIVAHAHGLGVLIVRSQETNSPSKKKKVVAIFGKIRHQLHGQRRPK